MTGLPEPGSAYALLIGVGDFDDPMYKALPSSYRSIEKLAGLLTDRDGIMWQLPPSRINVLGPQVTADEARLALKEATEQENLQSLLVCVSCHGHRYDEWHRPPGLHLAMTSSLRDLDGTHWRYDEISQSLARAKEERKIKHILLIVDACEADGLSVPPGQGSGHAAEIDDLKVPGMVVLTATKYRTQAWPHWPGTEWTAFLGALIQSIEDGIPGPLEILTAKRVFAEAGRRIADARMKNSRIPEPYNWGTGVSDIPLCRNRAHQPAVAAEGSLSGGPGAGLLLSDASECFSAIQAAHDQGRDRSVAGIVRDFCGNRSIEVDEVARLAGRLEASSFSDHLRHAYEAACAERSVAEIAAFAHYLHCGDVPTDERFVVSLHGRENAGRVAADVYQLMLTNGCGGCGEAAELISAHIVGDAELSAGTLAVWR
jgi:Caspase domain